MVPAYNEAGNIPELLRRFGAVARELALELIVVDNGSTDGTARLLEAAAAEQPFLKALRLEKNLGYGGGLREGLARCRAAVVGFTHSDLQCPPEDALLAYRLYRGHRSGAMLIKGRRAGRGGLEAFVSLGHRAVSSLALGLPLLDINAQPKIFPARLLPDLMNGPDDFSFDLFVLDRARRAGLGFEEFEVRFDRRVHGESKWAATALSRARGIAAAFGQVARIRSGAYD